MKKREWHVQNGFPLSSMTLTQARSLGISACFHSPLNPTMPSILLLPLYQCFSKPTSCWANYNSPHLTLAPLVRVLALLEFPLSTFSISSPPLCPLNFTFFLSFKTKKENKKQLKVKTNQKSLQETKKHP